MRPPGLTCALDFAEGEARCKPRANTRREDAVVRLFVIARSEATKQSRVVCAALDCFVALLLAIVHVH